MLSLVNGKEREPRLIFFTVARKEIPIMYFEILKNNNKIQTDNGLEIRHYFPQGQWPWCFRLLSPFLLPRNLAIPQVHPKLRLTSAWKARCGEKEGKGGGGGASGTSLFAGPTPPEGPAGGACAVRALCAPLQQAACLCACVFPRRWRRGRGRGVPRRVLIGFSRGGGG